MNGKSGDSFCKGFYRECPQTDESTKENYLENGKCEL